MIIKIKADDKYHIFDNVSKIDYYIKSRRSNTEGKITENIKEDESVTVKTSSDNPVVYNWISFVDKEGINQSIIFDTVAYVCNDNGKTIEIIRVN
jgi:hypothetical protein